MKTLWGDIQPELTVEHLKEENEALRRLVKHCWIHSGYEDCGLNQMDSEMRHLYKVIVEEEDEEDEAC